MGPALEVGDAALLEFGLETRGAPPGSVLPSVIGEHLPGRVVFAHGDPENLQHVLGSLAAKDVGSHQEARVIVHEADEVGIAATQPEGEDVRLPHLVGRGPLEKAGTDQVAPRLGRALNEVVLLERLADGLGAGFQEEDPLEQLGDAFDPPGRFLPLEFEDFGPDRLRDFGRAGLAVMILEALLAFAPVLLKPLGNAGIAHAHLAGD